MTKNNAIRTPYKKSKKSKKTRKTRKTRKLVKSIKNKKIVHRKMDGTGDKVDTVNCCMCENLVNVSDTLIPQICLNTYGSRAHRICQVCWWNPTIGFAREGVSHPCPGCEKNLALTIITSKNNDNTVIDLT